MESHELYHNANAVPFKNLCNLLEKIESTIGKVAKGDLLIKTVKLWGLDGQSLWPILRLVLPGSDNHRNDYNITDRSLAGWYVETLSLKPEEERLTKWIKFKLQGEPMIFGKCVEKAINKAYFGKDRLYNDKFTVGDANALLDRLSPRLHYKEFFGPKAGGIKTKKEIIQEMVSGRVNLSPQAHRWICGIILAASGTTISSLGGRSSRHRH